MIAQAAAAAVILVHTLEFPVPLWEQAQEQTDALRREFALATADAETGDSSAHLPVRLIRLLQELDEQYGGVATQQEQQLFEAASAGTQVLADLAYAVPASIGPAAQALGRILDEADEYCRQGRHLLTPAAPPEVVAFRWWFLRQFIDQTAGQAPVPWPQYRHLAG